MIKNFDDKASMANMTKSREVVNIRRVATFLARKM